MEINNLTEAFREAQKVEFLNTYQDKPTTHKSCTKLHCGERKRIRRIKNTLVRII